MRGGSHLSSGGFKQSSFLVQKKHGLAKSYRAGGGVGGLKKRPNNVQLGHLTMYNNLNKGNDSSHKLAQSAQLKEL